ncbi:MAG: cysteine desulfurase [Blautia sp.]|nr:cysteine desulfurase [Blautia sp.]
MEIYFDNAATTRCCPQAAEFVRRALTEDYGNPSSMHGKGIDAEKYVKDAAAAIAGSLKALQKELVFVSGGTEADNLAIFGAAQAMQRRGKHIITTAVEHPAVMEPMKRLEKLGYELTVLPVNMQGIVEPETLEAALRPDTILVSVMYVNNETGAVMPVERFSELVHEKSGALFHVDAVQAYGKYRIHPARAGIDLLSASGHKIHGPKGIGFLYIKDGVRIEPQILGGGQQAGMRSGTDNVPGIAGMAAAVRESTRDLGEKREYLYALRDRLEAGLRELENIRINTPSHELSAPHILNASFIGIRSEVLLHALEERGIYVSAGSACSSHKRRPSATLSAMGLEKEEIESAVRFSFCADNTAQEVDACLDALKELVPVLRRFSRR